MFWETLAAILLLAATCPIWISAALIWGLFRAAATLLGGLVQLGTTSGYTLDEALNVLALTVIQGSLSAWSIPSEIWDWAKYDHPWWAAIIGVAALVLGGESRR